MQKPYQTVNSDCVYVKPIIPRISCGSPSLLIRAIPTCKFLNIWGTGTRGIDLDPRFFGCQAGVVGLHCPPAGALADIFARQWYDGLDRSLV